MTANTPENAVKLSIKKYLATRTDITLASNPSGNAWFGKLIKHMGSQVVLGFARKMSFGVFSPGGPDMLGVQTITITPDMVGKRIGVFLAAEIKDPIKGRLTVEQIEVLDMLRQRGAIAGVVTSVEDFIKLVGE